MAKHHVEIYSADYCGYCHQAKQLLDKKGIAYTEIRVDLDPEKREEMIKRTGRRTVPEILIDGELIGGFDDLWAYAQSGKLDKDFNI
jgi:glutaredoxin 3